MRILQIIQRPQLRGAEIFACQLASEFVRQGIQVDVVYLFSQDDFDLKFDLNFIPLQASQTNRLWDIKAYVRLKKIIQKGKYDIVQANAADTLKYAVMSKLFFRWKAKIVFRNASLMGRLMHSPLQRFYNKWLLKNCDLIISVSENCRQDMLRFSPKMESMSVTIPIGTYSFDRVEPMTKDALKTEPIFINVGSFVWEKNHEFLITLFSRYYERYGKGYLWLVGDGKLKTTVEEKVRLMNLGERVIFWGSRSDAVSILKSADLMIMPSVVEGMPGAILEALSCGVPVLASSAGGISEVIRHNSNGFCLTQFSEEEYLKCMVTLTTDLALRIRFIEAGKQLINEVFKMPIVAQQFLDFYSLTLEKKIVD